MIDIKIEGLENLQQQSAVWAQRKKNLFKQLVDASYAFGNNIVRTSKLHYLSGPRPEKLDRVTSRLISSIKFVAEVNDPIIKLVVGTDVPYAAIHEYGGVTGKNGSVHMPKRPFLHPAFEDEKPIFMKKVQQILRSISSGK